MLSFRRGRSPEVEVAGITLDVLYRPTPVIYDPIPENDHSQFTHFRGLNLGKLACNILQGRTALNTGEDNLISFGSYLRASWAARSITESGAGDIFQFSLTDREFIESKTGIALPTRMPAMIIALSPSTELGPLVDIERYDHETPIRDIEPISRMAIKELFTLPEELVS